MWKLSDTWRKARDTWKSEKVWIGTGSETGCLAKFINIFHKQVTSRDTGNITLSDGRGPQRKEWLILELGMRSPRGMTLEVELG